jgi:hypothetical protein
VIRLFMMLMNCCRERFDNDSVAPDYEDRDIIVGRPTNGLTCPCRVLAFSGTSKQEIDTVFTHPLPGYSLYHELFASQFRSTSSPALILPKHFFHNSLSSPKK